ncbi:MAG: M15 family metallopeptidase [Verrucomicrobiales bacterium]
MYLLRLAFFLAWLGPSCRSVPEVEVDRLRVQSVDREAVVVAAAARGLVPVETYDRGIAVSLAYGRPDNVFGRVLYPPGFPALAHDETARKLAAANTGLAADGLRLVVLDAYRPPEVQWTIYELVRSDRYVSDPRRRWSRHTYGRAVDVTLLNRSGCPVRMPSAFDDFSERASARYRGSDPEVRAHLTRLQLAMTEAGFSLYEAEWWHFNDLGDPVLHDRPPVFGRELGLPVGESGADVP